MPTYDEYQARARQLIPDASEDEIRAAYREQFDRTPVRATGPSLDQYSRRAREAVPDASDDEIEDAYRAQFGAPTGVELGRAAKRGFAGYARLVGKGLGALDSALSAVPGTGLFGDLGQSIDDYWTGVQNANAPSREINERPFYNPGRVGTQLTELTASQLPTIGLGGGAMKLAQGMGAGAGAAKAIGTAVASGLGGAQEAVPFYEEQIREGATPEQAMWRAVPFGGAVMALEALPVSRILGREPGRLLTGAIEATTEIAEEPIQAFLSGKDPLQATVQGAEQVGLPAFLFGAALGGGRQTPAQAVQEQTDAIDRAAGLVDQPPVAPAAEARQSVWPALPAPPDFTVDAAGNAAARGQARPEPLALPAPVQGGWQVDSSGNVTPQSEAAIANAVAQSQQLEAQRAALGLGEADAIAQRMAANQAVTQRVEAERQALAAQQEQMREKAQREREVFGPDEIGKPPKREKVPVRVYSTPDGEVLTPTKRAQAEDVQKHLDQLTTEAGMSELPGKMWRKPAYEGDPNPEFGGRKPGGGWAHAWWGDRPAFTEDNKGKPIGISESQFQKVMKKMRAGKELHGRQEVAIGEWIMDLAESMAGRRDIGNLSYEPTANDIAEFDSLNIEQDGPAIMAEARLAEVDPEGYAAIRKEVGDDEQAFDAAIQQRLQALENGAAEGVRGQDPQAARGREAAGVDAVPAGEVRPLGERIAGGSQRGSFSTRDIKRTDNLGRPLPEGQESLPLPEGQAQQPAPGFGLQPPEGQAGRPAQQGDMFGARPLGERLRGGKERGSVSFEDIGGQAEPQAQRQQAPNPPPAEPGRMEIGGGDYAMNLLKGLTPEQFGALKWAMQNLDSKVEAQRRGTRSWDATMQAAADKVRAETGLTLETLVGMKPGTASNAEQLAAYGMTVANATRELEVALKKAATTQSNEDIVAALAAKERLATLMTPFLATKTEAGRALNILRANAKNFRGAETIISALPDGSREAILDLARQVEQAGSIDQVVGRVKEAYTPDWLDKVLEYRVSMGLLSGITTHQVNVLSNVAFNAFDLLAQGGTVLIGQTDARAFKARLAATLHGFSVGLSNAKVAFQTETPQLTGSTQVDSMKHRAIGGKAGRIIRIPTRLLMAEDEIFKSVAYHQELADLAMSEAIKRSPENAQAEFHKIIGDPYFLLSSGLADKAKAHADKLTFQTKLGPVAAGLAHASSKGGGRLLKLIFPFIRTPINIIKSAVEFSPAAYSLESVRDALSRGGRDQALAYSRMSIGSSLMVGAIAMAAQGMITGAGPDDEQDRRLWLAQGRQPYSIKIGDKWVQYNRFDPMGTVMGIAADMYDLFGYMSEGQIEKLGSALVTSIALNITDKTFLKGVTDFSEAVSKPDRYMAPFIHGIIATAVPNFAAQGARWMDPYQREARTLLDQVKARVPVVRQELAARIGITGEPQADKSATPLTMGAKVSTPRDDKLLDTMIRLGVSKGMPSRDIVIGKVRREVTEDDYAGMASFVQRARFDALTPVVSSQQFQMLQEGSPEAARAMLEQAWDQIGTKARMAYLFQNPAVMQRAQAKKGGLSLAARYQEQGR